MFCTERLNSKLNYSLNSFRYISMADGQLALSVACLSGCRGTRAHAFTHTNWSFHDRCDDTAQARHMAETRSQWAKGPSRHWHLMRCAKPALSRFGKVSCMANNIWHVGLWRHDQHNASARNQILVKPQYRPLSVQPSAFVAVSVSCNVKPRNLRWAGL